MVQVLLEAGTDPNLGGRDNVTPLRLAADRGLEAVVRSLVACGADVHAVDDTGRDALFPANRRGAERAAIAAVLREAGAR